MKTAIVGAGVISRVHANALKKLNIGVSAVCDVKKEKAESLIKEFSLDAEVYTDYDKMLEELKPDFVHICTPHYLHAEMIVKALLKNVNVLCEKPLCIKKEDIPLVLEAEKKSLATLGVCHQNRYNPANLFVKDFLKDKKVSFAHGSVVWHRDKAYYDQDPTWRGKWSTEGGGVLINQALHTLDLLEWFLGEPKALTATVSNISLKDVIEVEDTAFINLKGEIDYSFFATNSASDNLPVEINFKLLDGSRLTLFPNDVFLDGKLMFSEKNGDVVVKSCYGSGHVGLIEEFYDCVKEKRPFPIDGTEGAKVIKVILSAYSSNGKEVQF